MKIKSLLVLAISIFYSISAFAQLPIQNSTNTNKNKSSANPTFNLLQNAGGTFNIFGESKSPVYNNSLPFNKLAANCSGDDSPLAPQAADCNGASVTSIAFSNASRTLISGTANTITAVYRYKNAGVAPDGTVLDALVSITNYANNQDTNLNDFANDDLPAATAGFDQNLQPSIGLATLPNTTLNWNGSITYRIRFVVTGTSTPKRITVAAISIDNDGSTRCGGLKESVTYSTALNQVLTTATTAQTISGGTITAGANKVQTGIGTGADFASAALYLNVEEFNWTYSFSTGNNICNATNNNGGGGEVRYGSLNLNCQVRDFGRSFASTSLSGKVFNDVNGVTGGIADQTGTNVGGKLFATLVDANGYVLSSVAVANDGTYTFAKAFTGTYTVQLNTVQDIESNRAPAPTLPAGWVNTGENLGTGTGTDGAADGSLTVLVGTTAIINANFGIEQLPVPVSSTLATQNNPGGTISVTVPGNTFAATDPSTGGSVASLRITGFPANATSLTVGTVTYYPNTASLPTAGNCPTGTTCSVFPAAGVPVTSNAAGNATQTIKVDPISGGVTVGIPYVAIDNAGLASTTPAKVNVPFAAFSISGNVLNDTNGLRDMPNGIVNGSGTNAGGLFANLLDGNNRVVQTVAVPPSGVYSFAGVDQGTYTVQISINQGTVGSAAPATALPSGWINTGENIGTGAGSDGNANGLLSVTVGTADVANANFGIEQRPTVDSNVAATQTNPGGTNSATVPAATFSGTDATAVTNIRITSFPTNATSFTVGTTTYYPTTAAIPATCPTATCAAFPTTGGVTIAAEANGNPTPTIKVDPIDGAVTVVFTYVTVDAANVDSVATATASVPFSTVSLSGKVFNDFDGSANGVANQSVTNAGTDTGTTKLYANLLDSANNVVQSVLIPATGVYSFAGLNSGNYTVQLSTNQGTVGNAAPTKALPAGWVNTGENFGAGTGTDGTADGLLAVVVGTTSVTDANFGIEQIPLASDKTETVQNNPGSNVSVTVSPALFTGSDSAPGTITDIRVVSFPTNATSFTVGTTTYYPNQAAVPATCPTTTCAAFPTTGGLTIAAAANGNPTPTIKVDPIDGAVTVAIKFVTIDNAGFASSPDASAATVSIPFKLAPSSTSGVISGTLYFNGNPIQNALVSIIDTASNSKSFARTDADGNYNFDEKSVGKTYIVQPLSNKYSFNPGTSVVNLVDSALGLNFNSTAKKYHPKNDFDGDGRSDIAVYRPAGGNWYVLKSSDGQFSSFQFGADTDVPVSGDFDGDGKSDYAVFRPESGVWYIWQSKTQDLRAEQFGAADDKLVPADYDGDGKDDIAVYRKGNWYIRRSSDGAFEAKSYGADTDKPMTGDFDGDGKSDLTVYRPADGIWYTLQSTNQASSARQFGAETDVPTTGDFDGDGFADIAQFRSGIWYVQNSTTDFEASRFGAETDRSIVGDYDGDGRADTTIFRDGLWAIRNSGDGTVKYVNFGLPTDILVK